MDSIIGFMGAHVVTGAIFLPLVGAIVVLCLPQRLRGTIRALALAFSLAAFALCAAVFVKIKGTGELEFMEVASWIPSLGIHYRVGVDGVSAALMCLCSLSASVAVLASWVEIDRRPKLYYCLLLAAETGMLGYFASVDAFLLYVFWNASLAPICAMVGIWGGDGRIRIAFRYALFAALGSAAMLVAVAYAAQAAASFELVEWFAHRYSSAEQTWLFVSLAFAFGIAVPLIGLHSWFADVCEGAPTGGAILVAGAVLKMGAYGLFRVAMPLAPAAVARFAPAMLVIASATAVVGALLAMAQDDLKRFVAAASISQMGIVVLGLFALQEYAAAGAMLLVVSSGLVACGALFLAGMLSSRRGSCDLGSMRGLARSLPLISSFFVVFALALAGMPGMSNFAGESILMIGSFQTRIPYSAAALIGALLVAASLAVVVARAFFGTPPAEGQRRTPDIRARELATLVPLAALVIALGVWPNSILERIWRPSQAFVRLAKRVEMIVPAQASRSAELYGAKPEGERR